MQSNRVYEQTKMGFCPFLLNEQLDINCSVASYNMTNFYFGKLAYSWDIRCVGHRYFTL